MKRVTNVYICALFDCDHGAVNLIYDVINFFPWRIRISTTNGKLHRVGVRDHLQARVSIVIVNRKFVPHRLRGYHYKQVSISLNWASIHVEQHCSQSYALINKCVISIFRDEDEENVLVGSNFSQPSP
jgi:hypothetical protein